MAYSVIFENFWGRVLTFISKVGIENKTLPQWIFFIKLKWFIIKKNILKSAFYLLVKPASL